MQLTQAQKTALKNALAANANTVVIGGSAVPINQITIGSQFDTPDNWFLVAAWYNQLVNPAYFVWNTAVDVQAIFNATTFANFTPADAVPTDTALNVSIWTARAIACQGKQFNYEIMLQGRSSIDASLSTFRAGLKDACANLPSGASGAILNAGYPNSILPILSRQANNIEKVFATGAGTNDAFASTAAQQGTIDFATLRDAAVSG